VRETNLMMLYAEFDAIDDELNEGRGCWWTKKG